MTRRTRWYGCAALMAACALGAASCDGASSDGKTAAGGDDVTAGADTAIAMDTDAPGAGIDAASGPDAASGDDLGEPPDAAPEPPDVAPVDVTGLDTAVLDVTGLDESEPDPLDAATDDASPKDAAADADAAGPDVCTPSCGDHECDDDGCGGSCGTCPTSAPTCIDGYCVGQCTPLCDGNECGDDGCEGTCGECAKGNFCGAGVCKPGTECASLAACSGGCGADQTCLDACFADASLDGLTTLSDFQVCLLGACSTGGNKLACIAASCLEPYTTCYAGTLGSGSCGALLTCNATCKSDSLCYNTCMSQATLAAVGLYLNYVGCLASECPTGSPVACYADALAGPCKPLVDECKAQP